MGVYINGMEMPTTCAKCPLGHINAKRYAIECYAEYHTKLFDYDLTRHSTNPFCPLIPVPPHGRLIDAEELCKDGCGNCYGCPYDVCIIANAPTIIPAEEVKE